MCMLALAFKAKIVRGLRADSMAEGSLSERLFHSQRDRRAVTRQEMMSGCSLTDAF